MTREWPVGRCHAPRAARATIDPLFRCFRPLRGAGRVLAFAGRAATGEGEVDEWAELLSAGLVGQQSWDVVFCTASNAATGG